jgi:hypothetical protein
MTLSQNLAPSLTDDDPPDHRPGVRLLLEPQAQHLLGAIGANAGRDVDGFVADHALVADLHPQGVEEDERTDRVERALLPDRHLVEHGVRHRADQVRRHVDAVQIVQVSGDLPGAHAARVHRHDPVIEAGETPLVFRDQLRVEARLTVARHVDRQLAGVGDYRLPAVAVARVARIVFPSQVMIHLRVQGAFGQRLLQRIQQAALCQGGASVTAGQQLIQQLVRYRRLFASRHIGTPSFPLCPPAHEIPDSPTAAGGHRTGGAVKQRVTAAVDNAASRHHPVRVDPQQRGNVAFLFASQ